MIRNVTQGFILGLDFLIPQGAVWGLGRGFYYLGGYILPLLGKSELAPYYCAVYVMTTIPSCEIICRVAVIPPVICPDIPHRYKDYLEPRQLEMDGISVARNAHCYLLKMNLLLPASLIPHLYL